MERQELIKLIKYSLVSKEEVLEVEKVILRIQEVNTRDLILMFSKEEKEKTLTRLGRLEKQKTEMLLLASTASCSAVNTFLNGCLSLLETGDELPQQFLEAIKKAKKDKEFLANTLTKAKSFC